MQVRVLFFGMLKDVAGRASELLTLPEGATAADVLSHYEALIPRLKQYSGALAVSINQEYAAAGTRLSDQDEVGLLPPVSGGTEAAGTSATEPLVRIVRECIRPHEIVPPLERPEDGAVVIFDGVARNNSRGRRTLYLQYEAYEEMALRQLRTLAAEALTKFPVRNVAVVHRVGRVEIGESSVRIAVFSAHRAAAFDACRWFIDTLKTTVPIWKKEYFEDGAVWADGEAFPEDHRRGHL